MPTLGLVLAGDRDRATGEAARRAASTRMTPRRKRSPSSPRRARRSTICRRWTAPLRVYHPGRSARLAPRPEERAGRVGRASSRRSLKAFDLDGPVVAAEIFLDAIPQKRGGAGHMREAYRAAGAAGGEARLRLPAARRAPRRTRCCARCAAPTRQAIAGIGLFDVFTGAGRARGAEVARGRGHPPAGREELHRRGTEGDLRADRRRRGQGRCPAPRLRRAAVRAAFADQAGWAEKLGFARSWPGCTACSASGSTGAARSAGACSTGRAGPMPAPTMCRCGCAAGFTRWSGAAQRPALAACYPPNPTARRGRLLGGASARRCTSRTALAALARQRAADQRGRPLGGADGRAARRRGPVSASRSSCSSSAPARGSTCCSTDMATISAAWPPAIRTRRFGWCPNGRATAAAATPTVDVAARAGVDLQPMDARRDGERLLAYVWPDQPARLRQLEAALAVARSALRTVVVGHADPRTTLVPMSAC